MLRGKSMQMLVNIAFGAVLATATLGPGAWADVARARDGVVKAVMAMAGPAETPLDHAVARARAALPELPGSGH